MKDSLNEYQRRAYTTALPKSKNLTYMLIGLVNEAGEAAGKLKKIIRGDKSIVDMKPALAAELGDTLWYLAGAATELGYNLKDLADQNIKKLEDRKVRGKLQGDGDSR